MAIIIFARARARNGSRGGGGELRVNQIYRWFLSYKAVHRNRV